MYLLHKNEEYDIISLSLFYFSQIKFYMHDFSRFSDIELLCFPIKCVFIGVVYKLHKIFQFVFLKIKI